MASSPSKDSAAPAGNLTQRDYSLLLAALECNKNDIVVAYAKFAEKIGLANANSAKASWHGLKKKLDKAAGVEASKGKGGAKAATEDAGEDEAAKPKTKGRKRKTPVEDAEDDAEAKPKGKKRAPAAKKGKKGAAEVKETIENEEGVKSEPEQ